MEYSSSGLIVASIPVPVGRWCCFSIRQRAAKCVLAPRSKDMTASGATASERVAMAVCGRSGLGSAAFGPRLTACRCDHDASAIRTATSPRSRSRALAPVSP
jgi:hypothetical protein